MWCASSNSVTNIANVNNNGNPNNNNANNANAAAPCFCQTVHCEPPESQIKYPRNGKNGVLRQEGENDRAVRLLNSHDDADVRTLLAWSGDCAQLRFHARTAMRIDRHATPIPYIMPCEVIRTTSEERRAARRLRRSLKREEKRQRYKAEFDNYERLASVESLVRAAYMSRRGVGRKASVQKYMMNLMMNSIQSHQKLMSGQDVRQGFIEFDIHERGKARHIKAMHVKERVIQRSLCDNALVPVLRRSLVYDNGASLKGKGIHFALFRLRDMLRRFVRKHGADGYVLLVDFSGYFNNIRHEPIKDMLVRNFDDRRIRWLAWLFVKAFGSYSIGIGSQVSQIFAVAYPSRVDHRIKEWHRIGTSARYMDDTYVISSDKKRLENVLSDCSRMWADLGIRLHPHKTQIIPIRRFSFMHVRFRITKTGRVLMLPNRKSFVRMRRKLRSFAYFYYKKEMTFDQINTCYQSWYGYQTHFDSHRALRGADRYFHALFGVWPKHNGGDKTHDYKCING